MTGVFGVVSKENCLVDLFYGTDYHSHLGTENAGLAVFNGNRIQHKIHDIEIFPFRSRFENWINSVSGTSGIGVISDYEPQPLIIDSHLGNYAIAHVGAIKNLEELVNEAHRRRTNHFTEMSGGRVNPVELIATLINQGNNFVDGVEIMQNSIDGSSSLAILTEGGIYLARDRFGRTPLVIGRKNKAMAVTLETSAFPNLDFEIEKYIGPGEIGFMNSEGYTQLKKPENKLQICSFLWIYYGFPASNYEGINTEVVRNKCGEIHAERDLDERIEIDFVAGIPDSGTAHGQGYANRARVSYKRPYVKYSPTWSRSFMPPKQETRDLIAKMKLIPIREIIDGKRILFCEDSIVRGTQLKKKIRELFDYGAKEVHIRPACPPLTYGCKFLNFSRSKSELDLAARRAIAKIEGGKDVNLAPYLDEDSEKYESMVEEVRRDLGLTSLRYQKIDDMVRAVGLSGENLCLGCWR